MLDAEVAVFGSKLVIIVAVVVQDEFVSDALLRAQLPDNEIRVERAHRLPAFDLLVLEGYQKVRSLLQQHFLGAQDQERAAGLLFEAEQKTRRQLVQARLVTDNLKFKLADSRRHWAQDRPLLFLGVSIEELIQVLNVFFCINFRQDMNLLVLGLIFNLNRFSLRELGQVLLIERDDVCRGDLLIRFAI